MGKEVKVICEDTGDYFYGILDSSSGFNGEPICHTIIQNGEFYKGEETKEDLLKRKRPRMHGNKEY